MLVGITGGTGFVGRRLVERHLEAGDRVRVLSRRSGPAVGFPDSVELVQGDLTVATDALARFSDGLDVLYHCAGEVRDRRQMQKLHVDGTRLLLDAAARRIGTWVQLSSVGVYGAHREGTVTELTSYNPSGLYEVTKAESDALVIGAFPHRLQAPIILRPSIVFGRGMPNGSIRQMARMIERGLFFFIGPAGASANYVEITNVIDALVLCGSHSHSEYRVYNLSDWCTVEQFVAVIAECVEVKVPALRLPEAPVRFVARALGSCPHFPLKESRVDALVNRSTYSTERIERELGYRRSVSIGEGLCRLLEGTTGQ
jgi:nucleoside-diphosphate-sugar epimerase